MMNKVGGALGALLALTAGTALAQDDNVQGFYLGVGLGEFSAELDNPDDADDVDLDFDEDESATRIFAGWRFNKFISAQLDYTDFGQSTAALDLLEVTADTKGFAPTVVGTLPIGPIELFAKVGMIFYDLDVNIDGGEVFNESGEDVVYGVGIGATLFERLALGAEYERIEISEFDDADAVWLTAAWRF
jgi:OOP family OmpA-OmpF porin